MPNAIRVIDTHSEFAGLAWSSSGHTGTANYLAGFDAGGAATNFNLGAWAGSTSITTLGTIATCAAFTSQGTITGRRLVSNNFTIYNDGADTYISNPVSGSLIVFENNPMIYVGNLGSPSYCTLGAGTISTTGDATAGGTITGAHLKDTSLTSGRVALVTTGGQLADSVGLTYASGLLQSAATTEQLRLAYTAGSVYTSFTVSSGGVLTIVPTGSLVSISGNLASRLDGAANVLLVDNQTTTGYSSLRLSQDGTATHCSAVTHYGSASAYPNTLVLSNTDNGNIAFSNGTGRIGFGQLVPTLPYQFEKAATGVIVGIYGTNVNSVGQEALIHVAGTNTVSHYGVMIGGAPTDSPPSIQKWAFIVKTNDGTGVAHTERIRVTSVGDFGVNTSTPRAKTDILATTEQLRLTYTDNSVYTSFTVSSGGDLTIAPSGGDTSITGTLTATSDIKGGGYKSSDGTAGATADVAVAKVGGGTRTLSFKNGLYTGYTDS